MPKKVIENSVNETNRYVVYEDFTADVVCGRCKREDRLTAERFEKMTMGDFNRLKDYICLDCWKEEKEQKRKEEKQGTEDRIAYAQSFNLAVQAVIAEKENNNEEELKKKIIKWQEWFYNQLKKGEK